MARRIEQVRRTYLRLAPGLHGTLFPPPEESADPRFSAGYAAPGKWQLTLTLAGLVGLVNSVAAGALVGLLAALAGLVPGAAAATGTVTCLVLIVAHIWIQDRTFTRRLR
jgi:predicted lipid-binding transport protein (Tim44 family)